MAVKLYMGLYYGAEDCVYPSKITAGGNIYRISNGYTLYLPRVINAYNINLEYLIETEGVIDGSDTIPKR